MWNSHRKKIHSLRLSLFQAVVPEVWAVGMEDAISGHDHPGCLYPELRGRHLRAGLPLDQPVFNYSILDFG